MNISVTSLPEWNARKKVSSNFNYFQKLLFLSLFINPIYASGDIYKWVDENGKTHYGDRPTGTTANKMEIESSDTPPPSDSDLEKRQEEQYKLLKIYEEERHEKYLKKVKKNKEKLEKLEKEFENIKLCLKAKGLKISLRSGDRVYKQDEDGNRVYLNDDERESLAKSTEEFINDSCK